MSNINEKFWIDFIERTSAPNILGKEARNVANVIKRLSFVEKFNNITFWISISIKILSDLVFPVGVGFGIHLALASPKLNSYIERKRYRWALVDVAVKKASIV
jgi:hypothetical protein